MESTCWFLRLSSPSAQRRRDQKRPRKQTRRIPTRSKKSPNIRLFSIPMTEFWDSGKSQLLCHCVQKQKQKQKWKQEKVLEFLSTLKIVSCKLLTRSLGLLTHSQNFQAFHTFGTQALASVYKCRRAKNLCSPLFVSFWRISPQLRIWSHCLWAQQAGWRGRQRLHVSPQYLRYSPSHDSPFFWDNKFFDRWNEFTAQRLAQIVSKLRWEGAKMHQSPGEPLRNYFAASIYRLQTPHETTPR